MRRTIPGCEDRDVSCSSPSVRIAGGADARAIGAMLHDFNTEFGDLTPGAAALAERIAELMGTPELDVLLAGSPPVGLAVLRFRPSIWTRALECYVAELYVRPARRREGFGRALMQAAMEHARSRGAEHIDLGTGEQDAGARALYERLGFSNREGGPDGPLNFFYERGL